MSLSKTQCNDAVEARTHGSSVSTTEPLLSRQTQSLNPEINQLYMTLKNSSCHVIGLFFVIMFLSSMSANVLAIKVVEETTHQLLQKVWCLLHKPIFVYLDENFATN